jgi:hypothetical protein
LNTLITNYPGNVVYYQIHLSDTYQITWGSTRFSFYGGSGIPHVEFDGKIPLIGTINDNDAQTYNWYNTSGYTPRHNTATDVSIELTADLVSGQTYTVHAKVSVDEGGASRTMRIYMIHALDNYPTSSDHQYRFCLRAPTVTTQDVTLAGGQTITVDRNFTFDSTSWNKQSDIRIIAWAQVPQPVSYKAEVYNAAMMSWPFPPSKLAGDLNCDGLINAFDIDPFVQCLVSSTPTAPCTSCNNADINDDDVVNAFDIDPFVQCIIDGGCS